MNFPLIRTACISRAFRWVDTQHGIWLRDFRTNLQLQVPLCGGGDTSKANSIKHIPIWNFHGALDGAVPVKNSRDMMIAIENAGATVVYSHCHNGNCTGLPDNVFCRHISKTAQDLFIQNTRMTVITIWDKSIIIVFSFLPWVFSQSKSNTAGIERENFNSLPKEVILSQNYPNPFQSIDDNQISITNKILRAT